VCLPPSNDPYSPPPIKQNIAFCCYRTDQPLLPWSRGGGYCQSRYATVEDNHVYHKRFRPRRNGLRLVHNGQRLLTHTNRVGIEWDWCVSHMANKACEHGFGTAADPATSKNPAARKFIQKVIRVVQRFNQSMMWWRKFDEIQVKPPGAMGTEFFTLTWRVFASSFLCGVVTPLALNATDAFRIPE